MALGTPTETFNFSDANDGTSFTTASFTPPANALLLLFVADGHATAAEEPTIGGTLGLLWTKVAGQTTTAGTIRGTLWWAKTTASPPTGTLVFTFATVHGSCMGFVNSITGANLTTPIKQSGTPFQSTTTDNPGITLPTAIVAGNLTMGFNAWNRTFVLPPGAGYTQVSSTVNATVPTIIASSEYKAAGAQLVDWTTTDDIQKVMFAIEVAAAAGGSNVAPTANAGADQTNVEPYSTVTLSGSGSDSDGTIASYAWSKVSGPTPLSALSSASAASPTYKATPNAITAQADVWRLTVTDNGGATGFDDVSVSMLAVTERAVIAGAEVPMELRAI